MGGDGGHASDGPGERMEVPLTYRPMKTADVLELDMGDGLIVYNHDSSLVHHLNPSAGLVWQLCDGEATVQALADDIADEYGLEPDRIRAELCGLVAELDALGLVRDAEGGE